jgi:hypothetical protein
MILSSITSLSHFEITHSLTPIASRVSPYPIAGPHLYKVMSHCYPSYVRFCYDRLLFLCFDYYDLKVCCC